MKQNTFLTWCWRFLHLLMATSKAPIETNNRDVDTYRNKLENHIRIQNLQVTCFPSGEWTVLSWVTISSSVEASYLAPTPRIFCWLWVSKDPVDNSPDLVEADRTLEGNLQEKWDFAQLYITVIVFSAGDKSHGSWGNWSKLEHM